MSICDVPVISNVCDTAGEQAAVLVSAPFDWAASSIGRTAAWLFTTVWGLIDTTTLVDVTNPAFVKVYNVIFGIAVFVMLMFFCLQLITGLIRRDPSALQRAALGLAKSVLGSFVVITLTATLLEIVDQTTIGIVQASGMTMRQMGGRIGLLGAGFTTINVKSPGVGAILTIFLGSLAIAAAAIVWFSMLIRKALLLVAVVMAPIALAGASWDVARGWLGKWASFVIALSVSKLVVVVVFLLAVGQTSSPIEFDLASIADPVAGIVLMFVAAFAPYMAYRFIAFVGYDIHNAMQSEQEAKSSLNRPVPIPTGGLNLSDAKKVLDGGGGAAGPGAAKTGGSADVAPAAEGGVAGAEGGAASAGAAGPVAAAVVVGAEVAAAGPKAARGVAGAADAHAAEADSRGEPQAEEPSPTAAGSAPAPGPNAAASPNVHQDPQSEPSPVATPAPVLRADEPSPPKSTS